MRGTITEGLSGEWLKCRVEWQFLGLEREDPVQVKTPTLRKTIRSEKTRLKAKGAPPGRQEF
jgi:hypothetical protein